MVVTTYKHDTVVLEISKFNHESIITNKPTG